MSKTIVMCLPRGHEETNWTVFGVLPQLALTCLEDRPITLHYVNPLTSSLANLGGEFFTDDNLIAAASMYVALPTLIVYFALQRYFIAGLTIGAEKG